MVGKRTPAPERFWPKVDKQGLCWEWTGSTGPNGYGRFWDGARYVYSHRFAFEALVRPLQDGEVIDHLCRNPRCVNPAHLEATTQRTNILRGLAPTAFNAFKTHCLRGHSYDTANTILDRRGYRSCLICRRADAKRYRDRQRRERGPSRPIQKTHPNDVPLMVGLRAEGVSQSQIGIIFGLKQSTVSEILSGKRKYTGSVAP